MCRHPWLFVLLALFASSSPEGQTRSTSPTLQYERPGGFSRGTGDPQTWIADTLDGVIHVYPFRPFHGDLAQEFGRTLFRDWISAPYREDRPADQPAFSPLAVPGATAAIVASFKNFNRGAPRQHLRVAVLASGRVALVDISANSSSAFERNRAAFFRLLESLRVVDDADPSRRESRGTDSRHEASVLTSTFWLGGPPIGVGSRPP